MLAYPNRSHSISEGDNTTRHLFETLTRFLKENLPRGRSSYYATDWLSIVDVALRFRDVHRHCHGALNVTDSRCEYQRQRLGIDTARPRLSWVLRSDRRGDPICPIRNVTAKYPPAMLVHGTMDTDVPYAESRNMAAKLAESRVKHEFIQLRGRSRAYGCQAGQGKWNCPAGRRVHQDAYGLAEITAH